MTREWWDRHMIEVLIGIAILGILAALAFDGFTHRGMACLEWVEGPPSYVVVGNVAMPIQNRSCQRWGKAP
jgi:hypothetical protein